jgi:RNA polymerase sigma factor (sigma-70 family)
MLEPGERDRLILSLGAKVHFAVARVFRKTPNTAIEREDILSEAWIGAITAVDSFDPDCGGTLGTYAEYKIRGRILDYLRMVDVVSRQERQKIKAGTMSAPVIMPMLEGFDAVDGNAGRAIASVEARHDVGRILGRTNLGRCDRAFLRRKFWRDESYREIARGFGVHESWMFQVNARILRSLRKNS